MSCMSHVGISYADSTKPRSLHVPEMEVFMQSRSSTRSFLQKKKGPHENQWDQLSLKEQNILNVRLDRVNKFISDTANAKDGEVNQLCFMYFRQVSPIQVFLTDSPPYPDGPIALTVQKIVSRLMEAVERCPPILDDFRSLREWEPALQIGIIPTISRGRRNQPLEIHWTPEGGDIDFLTSCGISAGFYQEPLSAAA